MGNCLSELKLPASDGFDMGHYAMWSVDDVMVAYTKYRAMAPEGAVAPPFGILKRDFLDIFADFSITSTSCGVAVLPLGDFDLFLTDEMLQKTNGHKEILALEVFVVSACIVDAASLCFFMLAFLTLIPPHRC